MPFAFTHLSIPDVWLIEARSFPDERGYFMETYRRSEFHAAGLTATFVQDNLSYSTAGVLRGLHYQKDPSSQGKLVWVARGEIFDVAVDLRRGSPTFGEWVGEVLSSENRGLMYVPEGFAHGFCVLSEEAYVAYRVTAEYAPDLDRGVAWDDPDLGIGWPVEDPVLSERDAALPPLAEADLDFRFGD